MKNLTSLLDNLPVPVDDGACDHLLKSHIPSVQLVSTSGDLVDLSTISGIVVAYFYPMIGNPKSLPLNDWNEIPGARGCTPQSCAFRDHYQDLHNLNAKPFGVSTQSPEEQLEARIRLKLPYDLLNDDKSILINSMKLPTFTYKQKPLVKRITLISIDGIVQKVFYPVFPPDRNAEDVITWLKSENA